MKKAEIHKKFDEIVAFAEVEKSIDTPVVGAGPGICPTPAACTCGWHSRWRRLSIRRLLTGEQVRVQARSRTLRWLRQDDEA